MRGSHKRLRRAAGSFYALITVLVYQAMNVQSSSADTSTTSTSPIIKIGTKCDIADAFKPLLTTVVDEINGLIRTDLPYLILIALGAGLLVIWLDLGRVLIGHALKMFVGLIVFGIVVVAISLFSQGGCT